MEEFGHNPAASRFEVYVDGQFAGEAHYRLDGDVATFDHTVVLPEYGGRGVAGRLVRHAMDAVRAAGQWKVRAECPYVAHWFSQHPDESDLLV